ncbi:MULTISPECIES: hypothetical protein [unclassified Caulobacter]|uniref:hypothetical protein n=1 Tax=unclassified Caulobacter TaxID=2648921 RepID=UPI000D376A9C|nr:MULTISPECIES: hypothetical protein [unclassified Caulobacter]PTS81860.1 hypothetical protein DBR21_18075 [Caulobacter sp. HMWF009]PTT04813.1 hypothetical protein DBR10_17705 [Caulobacter sp. HMWF025]
MKTILVSALALAALATGAQAGPKVSDMQYLQAARCRGLAASEALGKLDTVALDSFLRAEGQARELAVRASSASRITGALNEAQKATGEKKDKLIAERNGDCAVWLRGGQ